MKDGKSIFTNVVISLFSVLIFLVASEVTIRIYLTGFASELGFLRYASLHQLEKRAKNDSLFSFKKSFHRYLGYFPTPNYRHGKNKHNSLGYRGDEIALPKPGDEFRIVCLGGSTTYSSGVEDYRHAYPELLETELKSRGHGNVNVINAGAPGWSTWESLINFEFRVLDLAPDMIIVYHAVNDIHPRFIWPPEAYRGDNSGRSLPNVTSVFMPSILEYSTLFRFFMIRLGVTLPHVDISRTVDRRADTFYGGDFQYQKMHKSYPKGIFKEVSAKQMLETNKPVYYRRNLESIVHIAQARGITTVLATFAFSTLFEDQPRASSEEYVSAYLQHNQVMREIAQENDVYLFDFANEFPADKQYFHDGRHITFEGSRLKARLFADFIVRHDLVTSPLTNSAKIVK